jgi:hypothetical protein
MEAPYVNNFIYELDKKYSIDNSETIEICKNGFHYFKTVRDLFELYLDHQYFTRKFRIFEVKPEGNIINGDNKCCCSEITLIKELFTKDLLDLDNTGIYIYGYFKDVYDGNDYEYITKYEDRLIKIDGTGKWCYLFARDIKGANIQKLEDAVIKKDITGSFCYEFAFDVKGADIKKLEGHIIKKDYSGFLCLEYAKKIRIDDINSIIAISDAIIRKDINGEYCYKFAYYYNNIDSKIIEKLEDAVIEKDNSGYYCYKFAKWILGANVEKLKKSLLNKNSKYNDLLIFEDE